MKKIRVYLSAFAVVLAVGGAFATKMSPAVQGYIFDNSNPLEPKCLPSIECQNMSGPACTNSTGIRVQDSSQPVGGDCGVDLKRD